VILGQYSVADLRDLVKAKDADMAALGNVQASFGPTWQAHDPVGWSDWKKDYDALAHKYAGGRGNADVVFAAQKINPASEDVTPANDAYMLIIRILQPVEGTTTKGDKMDLFNRIVAEGGKVSDYQVPQPVAKDWDLVVYQATGKALAQVDPGLVGKKGLSTFEKVSIALGVAGAAVGAAYVIRPFK